MNLLVGFLLLSAPSLGARGLEAGVAIADITPPVAFSSGLTRREGWCR
jgi:hypothetical protein